MDQKDNNIINVCPACGCALVPGAFFCSNCGNRVIPEQQPALSVNEKTSDDPVTAEPVKAPDNEPDSLSPIPETVQEENVKTPDAFGTETAQEPPRNTNERGPGAYEYEMMKLRERRAQYADRSFIPENPNRKETKKVPGWLVAIIAAGTVLIVAGVLLFMGFIGYKAIDAAYRFASENAGRYSEKGRVIEKDPVVVGDKEVPSNSTVVINIEGDQETLAAAVYAKCRDSVVGIAVCAQSSSTPWVDSTYSIVSSGSGVVYSSDGYIITNCHVVSGALDKDNKLLNNYKIRVYTDSSLAVHYEAAIIGVDYTSDLAVLKIDATGLKPIEFETSSSVNIGDKVFVIGCPGGIEFMGSITAGIVGGLNRNLLTNDGYAYDLIQSDAAINPGNSGGAMVNNTGKLIGICEMKIVEEGFEGMGFAIASDTVKEICEGLMKYGKIVRPALGIQVNTSYDVISAGEAGLPAGAWIAEVEADSAAGKAGLKSGMIITEFNGVPVYNFVSLRAEIMKCSIGDDATVTVYVPSGGSLYSGEYKTFTIKLQSLEDEYKTFD